MSTLIPSFLQPIATPTAAAGGAKAVQQALKDVRDDAKELRQSLKAAAAAPAPTAIRPVGLFDQKSWSLVSSLNQLLGSLSNLLGSWFETPAKPPKGNQPSTPTPTQPTKGVTEFKVSSFNILGSSHTAPGGLKASWDSGPARVRGVVDLLEQKDVDVVGFQEMAGDQAKTFKQLAGDTFGLYPGPTKQHLASHNSIAWRKDTWELVEARTVDMVGHKGRNQPSPVVLLKNKQTGQQAYFTNFHNAPGYHIGTQQHNRDKARAAQVELVNKLKKSGLPVIVTGDMNEKHAYFNDMKQQAGMHAANEGPKGKAPRHIFIDWIFGSEGVKFTGFQRDTVTSRRKISDHGMLVSNVRIGGKG